MKKILLLSTVLAIAFACSEDSEKQTVTEANFTNHTKSYERRDSDTISMSAYKFGATRFTIEGNTIAYRTEGRKFYYLGHDYNAKLDLGNYSFTIDGDRIRLNGTQVYVETIRGIDFFGNGTGPSIPVTQASNGELDTPEIFLLMLVKHELSLLDPVNNPGGQYTIITNGNPPIDIGAPCSIWDTYYCAGVGFSQGAATSNMNYNFQQAVANGEYDGCTQIGAQESGAFSGGLVQLMTFCCP